MRVERIKAKTMQEAMEQIKRKLGDDAVILNTRSIPEGIEVIAARDSEEPSKTGNTWLDEVLQKEKQVRTGQAEPQAEAEDLMAYTRKGGSVSNPVMPEEQPLPARNSIEKNMAGLEKLEEATRTAREFSNLLQDQIESSQEQHKLWVEHEKQLDQLKKQVIDLKESILRQELAELKKKAQELEASKKKKSSTKTRAPKLPDPALKEFYTRIQEKLLDRGISQKIAEGLVKKVETYFNANPLDVKSQGDVQRLKNMLVDGLSEHMPVFPSGATKIISVIGPAGVGKTATCLKIALKESLVYNKNVALVQFSQKAEDVKVKQLSAAAKLPSATISTTRELEELLQVHADKDLIIIDFTVTAPQKLQTCLNALPPSSILMTLKADMKLKELQTIQKNYKDINYHALILTHLDRLIKVGMVVEIARMYQKPLSYIGKGSVIPDDIEYANKTKLSHMILKG